MSATNGTPSAGAHAGTTLSDKARELRRRLAEARLEARAIAAERSLRRMKESTLFDVDWVGPWRDLFQERSEAGWFPLGQSYARKHGDYFPFYQNEQQHTLLRDLSRIVVGTNNHAWGMLRGLRSFVIGTGHKFKVTGRLSDQKAGAAAARRVTSWLDRWARRTRWYERQRELFWRTHRDGDAILRTFPDDGWMSLRYVWPEQLRQPPGTRIEEWGFGVHTAMEDAETILGYWFSHLQDVAQGEDVDPGCVLHLKANVDTGIKRGLPDFSFGTKDVLDAAARLTRNLGEGSAVRAAIAYMRQHAGATEEEVQEFVAAGRSYQESVPLRDTYRDVTHMPPGSVVDFSEGMEHAGAPVDPGTEGHTQVVALLLRSAGVRWNAPEWLVSGDASNMGAFTSSLVAESPFVRSVIEAQDYYRTRFLEVVDAALACGVAHDLLSPEDLDAVSVDLVAPTPEVRNKLEESQRAAVEIPLGVDSPQNYCSAQGRDYDQISRDNQEHQDNFGDTGDTLPLPGPLGLGDDSVPVDPAPAGGNQLLTTVGGANAVADLQERYARGEVTREMALNNAVLIFGMDRAAAERLFPEHQEGVRQALPESLREGIVLEAGFTGEITDSMGRKRQYVDGKQVAGKGDTQGSQSGAHAGTSGQAADAAKAASDHVDQLAGQAEKAPKPLRKRVSDWIANKYSSLKEKYGTAGAVAVLGATAVMVPIPLPGTVLIPVALAEAVVRIRNAVRGNKEEVSGGVPDLDTILTEARGVIRDLYAAEGEKPPQLDEEKVRAIYGRREADQVVTVHGPHGDYQQHRKAAASDQAPHVKARAALDAMGLSHGHLSDEQATQLHDQITALHAKAGGKPAAVEKPATSPKVAASVTAVADAIAKDGDDPGPHSVERANKLLADLRANHTDEELVAIAKEITGRGGRGAKQALAFLHADLTAVTRALDSQKV